MQNVNRVPLSVVFGKRSYACSPVPLDQVEPVREFIVSIVGEVTPLDEMLTLSKHNPDWLNMVERYGEAGYVGAFAILPLNEEATQRFARNAMKGADITLKHIVQNMGDASSIYVGSIVSNENPFNRAATLSLYRTKMDEFNERVKGRLQYFSRPVSDDGLRIITKLGYHPVQNTPHQLGEMIYGR